MLQAGRTRVDDKIRAIEYKEFLKAWLSGVLALALYQPNFYILRAVQFLDIKPRPLIRLPTDLIMSTNG